MPSRNVNRFDAMPQQGNKSPVVAVALSDYTKVGVQTVSGYATSELDRVLLTAQTDPTENGIWLVRQDEWTRAPDWNADDDVLSGVLIYDNNTGNLYVCNFAGDFELGVTAPTFSTIAFGGSAGLLLPVEDEGVQLTPNAVKLNFTGGGVTATESNDQVTVDVPLQGGVPEAPLDGNQYGRESGGWTIISGGGGGVPEAPIDGNQYAREDATWTLVAAGSGSLTGISGQVPNHSRVISHQYYRGDDADLDLDANATQASWTTVGKTGGGSGITWNVLDKVPPSANGILLGISAGSQLTTSGVAGTQDIIVFTRSPASNTAGWAVLDRKKTVPGDGLAENNENDQLVWVPFDGNQFEIYWDDVSTGMSNLFINLDYRGFTEDGAEIGIGSVLLNDAFTTQIETEIAVNDPGNPSDQLHVQITGGTAPYTIYLDYRAGISSADRNEFRAYINDPPTNPPFTGPETDLDFQFLSTDEVWIVPRTSGTRTWQLKARVYDANGAYIGADNGSYGQSGF